MDNIIRTTAVELTTIPAIAYKLKLAAGGSGLRILRLDGDEVAVFTVDRRTGEAVAFKKVDAEKFPEYAVDEALELTSGLPYSSRGKIKVSAYEETANVEEDVTEEQPESVDMVDSPQYAAIVDRYSDEKGKMNYQLMNKDFIQFASRSSVVSKMVEAKAPVDDILRFVVRSRADFLTNSKDELAEESVDALIETLDEINPRSAFKELKAFIKRKLSR